MHGEGERERGSHNMTSERLYTIKNLRCFWGLSCQIKNLGYDRIMQPVTEAIPSRNWGVSEVLAVRQRIWGVSILTYHVDD